MQIKIDVSKSIEENANAYFEAAKKARKKLKGLAVAMEQQRKKPVKKTVERVVREPRKRTHWFEKFRWFITSDGLLCIGGRDAATNEIVIKKHTAPGDLVLHTDMAGSPFIIIKAEGKNIPETSIEEAAQFTAAMSRAWKNGLGVLDVFFVKPEQVTKDAQAGESLPRGAFMIRGKTEYLHPKVALSIGPIDLEGEAVLMSAPPNTFSRQNKESVLLKQGTEKATMIAKKLQHKFNTHDDLDTIIRLLPAGGVDFA